MNKKSFTLIELMIVIGIIAVLATIIIAVLNPGQLWREARDANRRKDLSFIATALEQYYADNDQYPNNTTNNITCLRRILTGHDNDCLGGPNPSPVYIQPQSMTITQSGTLEEYCYTSVTPFQKYTLCAPLEGVTTTASGACVVGTPSGFSGTPGSFCVTNPF